MDADILDVLENGAGRTTEERVDANSKGVALLIRHFIRMDERLDWHTLLLLAMLTVALGVGGSSLLTLIIVVLTS